MSVTLLSKLGGRDAIEAVVALFYERVLGDPAVAPFFRGVSMARLQQLQTDLFCSVLGGAPWTGRDLRTAHADLHIDDDHFDRIAMHLQAALEAAEVSGPHIRHILELVETLRPQIVTVPKTFPFRMTSSRS
jgi:hemoglobin